MSAASVTAALLSVAAVACCWRAALAHPTDAATVRRLAACACTLGLLGLVQVLSWDLQLQQWGRNLAKVWALYEWRRPAQALGLLLVLVLVMKFVRQTRVQQNAATAHRVLLTRVCVNATALIVMVSCLRTVSLHGLDSILSWRLQGLSLGRWLECWAALCICGCCVLQDRQYQARQSPLRAWEPPLV